MTRGLFGLAAAAGLAAAVFFLSQAKDVNETTTLDKNAIDLGQRLYAENCASCHGANLEGQPNWKIPLENGRYPAPPHDETGHTWHHADPILTKIIREGTSAVAGNGCESDMPGFGSLLSDDEIAAILDFIKSTWPERERAIQQRVTQESAS